MSEPKELERILRKKLKDQEEKEQLNSSLNRNNLFPNNFNTSTLFKNVTVNNHLWDIPVDERITSHRKVIGPFIVFFKKVVRKLLKWYVSKPLLLQRNFNGSVTRSINEIYQFINYAEQRDQGINKTQVNLLNVKYDQLMEKYELLQVENQSLAEIIDRLKVDYQQVGKLINDIQSRIDNENDFNINYLEFENKFRGTEEEIKQRQMDVYLPFLKGQQNLKVLDVGCGRGELVEGLTYHSFDVLGIDLNKEMADYCQDKGLNVIHANALEYLEELADNSIGTIFSLHVFEHLSPNQIINFLKLFHQKLEDGGKVILETPNPECLYTLAYGFTIDLTHRKLLHPYTMKFILEQIGFGNIQVKHLSPVDKTISLNQIESLGQNDATLNENIQKLNNLLYSYQDYAIIATK